MTNKKLFGTSGIRGKIGSEINSELALKIGKSLAKYLNNTGKVVIGYDTRTTNRMLEQAITAGLIEHGVDVVKIGMVPTPLVGYATLKLEGDAGIMLTASHNPSQYNGIKLWNKNGMAYTPEQEEKIEEIYYNEDFGKVEWDKIGTISHNDEIKKQYIDDLLDIVDIKPGLKVVIDCACGAGSELSPLIFRKAGCEVITLNSQVDGFFPGRNPEPNEANLSSLMKAVVATGSDLGIAHDGDADRMITVDEKGRVSEFDKLLALVSKKFGGTVVTTVDAGLCMDEAMEEVGGKVLRTKVGDVNVAEVMIEEDANFGKLSELLEKFHQYPHMREKVICSKEEKFKVMENMEDLLKGAFDDIKDINTIDGIRLSFNDGSWVLVRPSGTEDYVRITLEAKTEEKAEQIKDTCIKIIKENI